MSYLRFFMILFVSIMLVAAPARAQSTPPSPTTAQQQQMTDFANFVRAYEARFGPMPPDMRQNAVAAASQAIAEGSYPTFIAGFRNAIGVSSDFGAEAPAQQPSPGQSNGSGPADARIVGMRVYYLQRSPLGYSHASGYVHFCPGGFVHEGNEATLQNPTTATANVNAGRWALESSGNGDVVGIYYERGPRAGQRIEYNVADMLAGRWTTTNWRYAVDRQAVCP
ncbi:MAG: hypothetical protein AAFZ58_07010 [Pseudomonadota bacterium]